MSAFVTTLLTTDQTATLKNLQLHEQLERKKIIQTEEIATVISTAKAKIIHQANYQASATDQISPATRPLSTVPEHTVREPASLTCLPKLNLPQFSGNPSTGNHFGTALRQLYTITQF